MMERRRALMAAKDDDILFEWTPDMGLSNVNVIASSGETPRYTLLDDAIRLYGPNNGALKWTGLAMKENIRNIPSISQTEVYYKNVTKNTTSSIGVIARTYYTGKVSYATITALKTTNPATSFQLRGANKVLGANIPTSYLSGVVICKADLRAGKIYGIYPDGSTLEDTAGVDTPLLWLCAVETTGDSANSRYADITRIVIRRMRQ